MVEPATWHLVVDKIRRYSPASRPEKRLSCTCTKEIIIKKKKKKKCGYLQPAASSDWRSRLSMVIVKKKKVVFLSCFAYYPFIRSMYEMIICAFFTGLYSL